MAQVAAVCDDEIMYKLKVYGNVDTVDSGDGSVDIIHVCK